LCLTALQTIDVSNRSVLDVGTGSGVLAIAAVGLGAAHALGIDHDPDAIVSATENLALNPEVEGVEFRVADLMSSPLPTSDVVTANLTGALLVRAADRLMALVRPGGTLIVSGLMAEEEATVRSAYPSDVAWRNQEDEWVVLVLSLHLGPARLV
jgi:ribosomal protein L11 methyltransferase